ncbi:NADPH-dependent FMN reductase [Mesobacillus maritimus]|uniref:NAD(P)H-dependent oxidoreductase n=1 Tax=Mesobacillus maritimus TaxID=1643336 RepID=A0ABS7K0B7_9BACI|nr:NAD(P)H-dependent oxidoreductase [Mesobacillus maritimus]MBY0095697.1 NAD(P)H-dependent oxidoreductase [Mesobacillus maritimus]
MKVIGISGTIIGEKMSAVVMRVLNEIQKVDPGVEVELLDLKDYQLEFCDGRDPETYIGDTKKVIQIMNSGDVFLFATPIFNASLSGPLKNLIDLTPVSTLRNKVMGFIATGGTYQHYLVIENQLKPIAGYFRAYVAPSSVYLTREHFNGNRLIEDDEILNRIGNLAQELVQMQKSLKPNVKV